jgi:Protein of unknown function (DUF3489)
MRIYIIGSDGITLCRKGPATLNDGEIAVASSEELRTAPLSAKRLLALWNALPGVEKRKKVGDRDALIDQLWSAIEMLPVPEPQPDPKRPSKQDVVIAMLRQPEGATVDEVASVTGWQRHTVRGVFSGTLKKKLGLTLASVRRDRPYLTRKRQEMFPMRGSLSHRPFIGFARWRSWLMISSSTTRRQGSFIARSPDRRVPEFHDRACCRPARQTFQGSLNRVRPLTKISGSAAFSAFTRG